MENWLNNKHVFLIGASDGIGLSVAKRLSEFCSCLSILASNRNGKLNEIQNELNPKCKLNTIACDVRSDDSINGIISNIFDIEPVYGLVYCAGGSHICDSFSNYSYDDIDRIIDVNLKSTIKWLTVILPKIATNQVSGKKRGHVILLSSRSGERALPKLVPYAAAKGGIELLSEGLQREYARDRIAFTLVNPGSILTSFTSEWQHGAADQHVKESMDVDEVSTLIVGAMTSSFVINKMSFESMDQWINEPGVL